MSLHLLWALACAVGEDSGDVDVCADVPVVTWNNFGASFVLHNCQTCHASTTADRNGAPESVTFDTVDEVWALADRVLVTTASESPTMPPRGGVTDDDRQRLQWWLECAEPGT